MINQYESKISIFISLLQEWNSHTSLVADATLEVVKERHVQNSLIVNDWLEKNPELARKIQSVADLGSGGGFPGILLAITHPDWRVSLIESVRKKADFLNNAQKVLELTNVQVINARSEEISRLGAKPQSSRPSTEALVGVRQRFSGGRETFDLVTARAVAPLSALLELASPLLKQGGLFIAWKGEKVQEELSQAKNVLSQTSFSLMVFSEYPPTTLLVFEKISPTPARFPRRPGVASKSPLQ